jgi:CheY-like chemotaxis protein
MSPRKTIARKRARHAKQPSPRSILVVDDENGTVDVLIAVLRDAGFDASGASNGRDALAALAHSPSPIVLLDFMMPVLDGAETLRAIRKDSSLSQVRVVMMSGLSETMVKRQCRGYAAFLRKPFSLEELLRTVRSVPSSKSPR